MSSFGTQVRRCRMDRLIVRAFLRPYTMVHLPTARVWGTPPGPHESNRPRESVSLSTGAVAPSVAFRGDEPGVTAGVVGIRRSAAGTDVNALEANIQGHPPGGRRGSPHATAAAADAAAGARIYATLPSVCARAR
eukprot:352483-Chlamydomonas_euryale.AAC.10